MWNQTEAACCLYLKKNIHAGGRWGVLLYSENPPTDFSKLLHLSLSGFVPWSLALSPSRCLSVRFSFVCVCVWRDWSSAAKRSLRAVLADRLEQEGKKNDKKERKSPFKKSANIILLCYAYFWERYMYSIYKKIHIFLLYVVSNKFALWHGVTSKQSTSTHGCLKQRPGYFVVMKKEKKSSQQ